MPKWKKSETEFTVSLGQNDVKGYWCTVPKPIVELLNEPKKLTFVITKGNKVEIKGRVNEE
ncbi:MAG: hypothetical protein ACREAN_05845, partial [Nitrosopumilaceae archaeon]